MVLWYILLKKLAKNSGSHGIEPYATCTSPVIHLICPLPLPPFKTLHKHRFQFLFGRLSYPREMKNKVMQNLGGHISYILGDVQEWCDQNVRIPYSPWRIVSNSIATPSSATTRPSRKRRKNCVFSLRCAWRQVKQTTKSFPAGECLAYFFTNIAWPLQREWPLTKTGYLYM